MAAALPRWRSTRYATWRSIPTWSVTRRPATAASSTRTLDNSDVNGFAYFGVSQYFTVDLRLRWRIDRQWSAAFGIDNLNNYKYWNFHPTRSEPTAPS